MVVAVTTTAWKVIKVIEPLAIFTLTFDLDGYRETRFAAMRGAQWVGTIHAKHNVETVTLFQLFVIEEERGKGVGRVIVEEAEVWAKSTGAQAVSAIVESRGPVGFWYQLGYKPAHAENGKVIVSKRLE